MEIVDIDHSPQKIELLEHFHHSVYAEGFPDPDERDSFAHMTDYLKKRADGWYGHNDYHIRLALQDGVPVGGVIGDYLAGPNVGVVEFLVVGSSLHRLGLGHRLHTALLGALHESSRRAGYSGPDYIFGEMNDPHISATVPDNMHPRKRALIWKRWGYYRANFPYIQPPLTLDQNPVETLCVIVKPLGGALHGTISSCTLKHMIHEYMVWAMRIEHPAENLVFQRMAAFLDTRQLIDLADVA